MATTPKPGNEGGYAPYCAFRNDRDRLLALVSRDIRLVLIAVVGLLSPLGRWLMSLV